MTPVAVDPAALDGAGAAVVGAGEGVGSVISTLIAALSGCAGMAGADPAGAAFGRSYDGAAAKLIQAMVTTRNGLCNLGAGVRMSAHNYSLAEAISDVGGRAGPLPLPPSSAPMSAGSPPSAVGSGGGAPPGWGWVAPYIGMIWPTGDSAKLRAAAAAWSAAGTKFAVAEILGAAGPMGVIRGQHIPEGGAIDAAFSDAYGSTTAIVGQCQTIAAQLTSYAAKIDRVHAAILDLLSRICDPLTGIKEVWEFLTDEDEDEIKKIANDIRTVIDDFTGEVNALGAQIATVLAQATTVVTTMGRYAGKQWDHFLHGNPVGKWVNHVGQFSKGVGLEAWELLDSGWTYSQVRLLVDPEGYFKSLRDLGAGMAPLVGAGGEHAPSILESWKQLGKDVTHWDDWSKNPAEALGKTSFDVALLALPGGPISKLGKMGAAARDGVRALRKPPTLEPPDLPPVGPPAVKTPPPEPKPVPRTGPPEPAPKVKPTPAPAGTAPPHSPTESKPPVVTKPATGEPPKPTAIPPALADQRAVPTPTAPSEHLPPAPPPPAEPVPARASASPGGDPAEPATDAAHVPHSAPAAPAPTAPHAPQHSMPPSGHPPEPAPHSVEPGGHSHHGVPPDSPVEYPDAQSRTTISGHGAYYPDDGYVTVPRGTTITIYAEHGSSITEELGNLIETGGDTSRVYSRTFYPGEQMPNYTIYPPDGLDIMGAPQTVTNPTRLTELINEEMGNVHLAICPYDEAFPTGIVYDVDGMYDQSTGAFTPYIGDMDFDDG
jgi:hypothetical protein